MAAHDLSMRLALVLVAACSAPASSPTMPIAAQSPIDAAPLPPIEPDDEEEDHILPIPPAQGGKVVVTTTDACGMIVDTIYFEQNAVSPTSTRVVDGVADMLICLNKEDGLLLKLAVNGYADPSETDSDELSRRRAQTVATMLTARKMPSLGLEVVPYGARALRDTTGTAEGRARNRRVEFLILGRKTRGD